MITTAIILAGGLGTRLKQAVPLLPKCLAPVAGKPFIDYVINHLAQQGISDWIFALGYEAEAVQQHLEQHFSHLNPKFSVEQSPLGTGGALVLAASLTQQQNVVVVNADTLFKSQLQPAFALHQSNSAWCTVLLKPMTQFDRYGTVQLKPNGCIAGFTEKQFTAQGHINGGSYLLDLQAFLSLSWPSAFSFETDFLATFSKNGHIFGQVQDQFFIDIGIPHDYQMAQFSVPRQFPVQTAKDWTLFLDRDGVINTEKQDDYIHHWDELTFYPNAPNTIAALSRLFSRTVVVTNQKGIGKGITQAENVVDIHQRISEMVAAEGGKIDAFFYCPDTDHDSPNRKPNPGMAHQAKNTFPDINLSKSLMVGNNISDLQFGRRAGMCTAYLRTTKPHQLLPPGLADMEALDLAHLLALLQHPL